MHFNAILCKIAILQHYALIFSHCTCSGACLSLCGGLLLLSLVFWNFLSKDFCLVVDVLCKHVDVVMMTFRQFAQIRHFLASSLMWHRLYVKLLDRFACFWSYSVIFACLQALFVSATVLCVCLFFLCFASVFVCFLIRVWQICMPGVYLSCSPACISWRRFTFVVSAGACASPMQHQLE